LCSQEIKQKILVGFTLRSGSLSTRFEDLKTRENVFYSLQMLNMFSSAWRASRSISA